MTCGALALIASTTGIMQAKINYPKAKKVDVVDDYFGTKVADPYRWLEDDNSAETKQWVDAENKITRDYLDKIPFRKDLKKYPKGFQNTLPATGITAAERRELMKRNQGRSLIW